MARSLVHYPERKPQTSEPGPGLDQLAQEYASEKNAAPVNYRKWIWVIVCGVFCLFFVADTIEHAFLPRLHLGRASWFLTTAMATVMAYLISSIVLRDMERVHGRLIAQNQALQQQSERLSLSVQEAHHRIKNNLQTVASLLTWHAQQEPPDSAAQGILEDSVGRIRAIALVHDFLTRDSPLTEVNAADVVRQLTASVGANVAPRGRIVFETDLDDLHLSARRGTSLALIVNELLLNAVEHGFPGEASGAIQLSLKHEDDRVRLTVKDDGAGLPPAFVLSRDMKTGLDVVTGLVEEDLDGRFQLSRRDTNGTIAEMTFSRRIDD